jgi:hypothetical protein
MGVVILSAEMLIVVGGPPAAFTLVKLAQANDRTIPKNKSLSHLYTRIPVAVVGFMFEE